MKNEINLNAIRVHRKFSHDKKSETIFIPLPESAWRSAGTCDCPYCKGSEAYWDTLALAANKTKTGHDFTYTVHYPELHGKQRKA